MIDTQLFVDNEHTKGNIVQIALKSELMYLGPVLRSVPN